MKILGKKVQSDLFCDGDLYAVGGRPPIQWVNEHGTQCPPFGCFKITGYDVTELGAPLIRGTQPDDDPDGESLYAFNLGSYVDPSGSGYGCCRFDMPLVAAVDSSVPGVGELLGPQTNSWYLWRDNHGFLSLGPDYNSLCLITEEPECNVDGKNRFALALEPHVAINPNTIVGVYYTKYQCTQDASGNPTGCTPCMVEWMWAAYGWIGYEPIHEESELELVYMDDFERYWEQKVPPDDPDNPNMPRNRGPWFIIDASCPNVTPSGGYPWCSEGSFPGEDAVTPISMY